MGGHKEKRGIAAQVSEGASRPLSFNILKQKQRDIRDNFPAALTLRVHRALSWYGRAERETEDPDVKFILLWIAFNAAYAGRIDDVASSERDSFRRFFDGLMAIDADQRIYNSVWIRFSGEIRLLLKNKYVFSPFWAHHNAMPGNDDWESRLEASQRVVASAIASRDTPRVLAVVFDRLYVLRNQLVHGGATWQSSVNRDQVRDGAAVLDWLVPVFIDIMMDNSGQAWDMPHYPVVE